MVSARLGRHLLLSVTFALLVATTGSAVPTVAKQEYTIGAGSYGFDFVFLSDFHVAEGKKLVEGMDDFGTPGYADTDNDSLEMTPAIEGDIACVDYINTSLVGQPGYDIRFVVAGGDFTTSGERSELQRVRKVLGGLDKRPFLLPLVGNHDLWPYVGHGLSFYPPFPGYFEEQPEDEVVVGQYFVDAFRGVYDTLRFIQPAADWTQSEWLLEPTANTCHPWPSYYNNFAFSYQGCRFIVTDFNTRKDPPPSERPGLRGEPDVYSKQPYHWTLDWLAARVAEVRPGERIICLGHQPYDQEYTNFQMDELRTISKAGLLNNRPIATSIGGHIHPFGDKPGRQMFGRDTAWDYYRPNAAKDGKVYIFHIRDSVRLQLAHSSTRLASGSAIRFDAAYEYEGSGNAPSEFIWDFGDGSPAETAGVNIDHQFESVVADTTYKVSLRVTTASGRRVWACDTVRVLGPHAARTGEFPGHPALPILVMSVSPNPLAGRTATVRYSRARSGVGVVTVRDALGRVVERQNVTLGRSGVLDLDMGDKSAGVYLLEMKDGRSPARRKLVVQR